MKKIKRENYRVEVTPSERHYSIDHDTLVSDLRHIVEEIERHVDYGGSVDYTWDDVEVCEYCGRSWEDYYGEGFDKDDPCFCCEEAEADYKASKKCSECGREHDYGISGWSRPVFNRCSKCKKWYCEACFLKDLDKAGQSQLKKGRGREAWCKHCLEEEGHYVPPSEEPPGRKVRP